MKKRGIGFSAEPHLRPQSRGIPALCVVRHASHHEEGPCKDCRLREAVAQAKSD